MASREDDLVDLDELVVPCDRCNGTGISPTRNYLDCGACGGHGQRIERRPLP